MLIGIDFDNTIVYYDALFHRLAVERSLVPAQLPVSKIAVRDYLRKVGNEDAWTEMQGHVYGANMDEATAYPGVLEFVALAQLKGVKTAIVSHKTKYPFLGPKYDLHHAARSWVGRHLARNSAPLISQDSVFFELTKEEKIARIAELKCDYFIDDLPEILRMPEFPTATQRILFDSEKKYGVDEGICRFESWAAISGYFEGKWSN